MSRSLRFLLVPALVGALVGGCGGENPYDAAKSSTSVATQASTGDQDTGSETVTTNVFLPEGQDVSNCVGTLDRPECGSKAKGGWRQYLVLGVLALGVAFIGWRIARGVRQRDAVVNQVD